MAVQYRSGGDIFGRLNVYGDIYLDGFTVASTLENVHIVDGTEFQTTSALGTNVIFLTGNASYTFMRTVDLSGKRFVCGPNVVIKGLSPGISVLKSTGLSLNMPLISSSHAIQFEQILFQDHPYVFELDSANPSNAMITYSTNFNNCSAVGRIKGYNNISWNTGTFVNSGGLRFDGNSGSISMLLYAFQPPVGVASVVAMSSLNVSRRLRIFYSAMIVQPGAIGVMVLSGATIPNENLILDNINFSNGGTYLSGFTHSSNISRFDQCVGINNTSSVGHLYMADNVITTPISSTTDYFKMSGVAAIGSKAERFVNGNNRLTYIGAIERDFLITGIASMTSGNNNQCYIAAAKNGTILSASRMPTTTSGTGRADNIKTQVYTNMLSGDYIELWVRNATGPNNITVTDVNMGVEAL